MDTSNSNVSNEESIATDRLDNGSKEVTILGDSRVKFTDRSFCAVDSENRLRICLPGAKMKDIAEHLDDTIKGTEHGSTIIIHGGVNDIGDGRSEELMREFSNIVTRLSKSGRRAIVTGILPKIGAGDAWSSRAIGINDRVKGLCERGNVVFLDYWDMFWDRQDLYSLDGIHLSRKGVEVLGRLYEDCLEN